MINKKKISKFFISIFCFLFRWTKERPTVLMYHSVAEGDNPLSISPEKFEKQIKYLKENNFKFLTIQDLEDINNIPNKSVLITFDDGYKDNFITAIPILKKYGASSIFFIVTGLIGETNKGLKMMSWEEIKKISSDILFEVGAHTITHRKLHKLSIEEIQNEIVQSKITLEEKLGKSIGVFAYPYGRYSQSVLDTVKKNNFKFAFSTKPGHLSKEIDKLLIFRFGMDNYKSRYFQDVFKLGYGLYWRLVWVIKKIL